MSRPSARRRAGQRARRLVPLVVACALVALAPAPAHAHAIVLATEPAIDEIVARAPARVVMRFNEPVEIAFGALRVYDSEGERVDEGTAEHLAGEADAIEVPLRAGVPDGTYTVSWRVVSADGHAIEEAFVFHVGEPGANPEGIADRVLEGEAGAGTGEGVAFGIVRWATFAALLVLAGAAAFAARAWGRDDDDAIDGAFARRVRALLSAAWLVAVVGTLASIVLQGAVAGDVPLSEALSGDVVAEVASTRFGRVALARVALLALVAALLPWAARRAGERAPVALAGAALAATLATPGLGGHAGTTPPVALNVVADTLHVCAAAVWVGGLVALVAAAWPATARVAAPERARRLAPVVSRFSDAAVVAVAVVVATGLYRSWVEVRALGNLTGTTYGLVLVAKLAAFAPLLALGAVNNRWTKPRIEGAAARGDGGRGAVGALRRIVAAEVALGALVVAASALLVSIAPARVEAGTGEPVTASVALGDDRLAVVVDPARVGSNAVHLTVTTSAGAPADVRALGVSFVMPERDIGPLRARARELAPGHFVVQGRHLSVAGRWRLEVVARRDRFTEERAFVGFEVAG
ncbi:MAG TPA: CopD family protein [Actinomycetota bacterium]|nr:CopD family protein [Actinomycetota bacterium]